jgi:hypothetical protein
MWGIFCWIAEMWFDALLNFLVALLGRLAATAAVPAVSTSYRRVGLKNGREPVFLRFGLASCLRRYTAVFHVLSAALQHICWAVWTRSFWSFNLLVEQHCGAGLAHNYTDAHNATKDRSGVNLVSTLTEMLGKLPTLHETTARHLHPIKAS